MKRILSALEQAIRIMAKLDLTSWKKTDQKAAKAKGYRSKKTLAQRTSELARALERIFAREGIRLARDVTQAMIIREIQWLIAQGLASSTIQGYARALSDAHEYLHGNQVDFGGIIPSRSDDVPTDNRAYSLEQVREIAAHQRLEFSLATEIVYASGLRQSELNTIRPASEFPAVINADRQKKTSITNGRGGKRAL